MEGWQIESSQLLEVSPSLALSRNGQGNKYQYRVKAKGSKTQDDTIKGL